MKELGTKKVIFNLNDWLEKPVARSPKLYPPSNYPSGVASASLNVVSEHPSVYEYEASKHSAMAVSATLEEIPPYFINIRPMLSPQTTEPEYFMDNFKKATLVLQGISKVSFENFKNRTHLDYNQLADLLSVARNTLINKKGNDVFDKGISENLISLAELYTHGFDVFGNEEKFFSWLQSPNRALGGVTPFSLLGNQYGRREVHTILGRIEWGVYS